MKPPSFSPLTALLLLLVFCAGCLPALAPVTRPGSQGISPGAPAGPEALLEAAERAYNLGQYQVSVDNYKRYLQNVPDSPRLPAILAGLGLAAEKGGQFHDAVSAYERLTNEFPLDPFAAEARPRLAAVYLASGDAARAEELARALLPSETDPGRQAQLRLTLAQSQWNRSDYREAAGNFLTVWRSSAGQVKNEAREGVLASLTRLNQSALEEVQRQYGQNFPGPEATYLLARLAAQAGDTERVAAQAEYFNRYFAADPLQPQLAALVQAAGAPGTALPPLPFGADYNPGRTLAENLTEQSAPASLGPGLTVSTSGEINLAVILPLSAAGASRYAQAVLAGLRLAVDTYGGGAIGLTILDTAGSADEAARLVGQAAADPKTLAVVGPFLSREARSAALAAEKARLPLIAVSQRADLPSLGTNIFRLFLTPRHQTEAVARYAVEVQGHQALGILYPDDNFGRPILGYFEDAAQRLGAGVTTAEGYDPKSEDFTELAGRLTGGAKVNRQAASSYQAETNFTVLYLPDSASVVSRILPTLAYHDITKMAYLGSPLWLNQEFLLSSARYVQGAVIPAPVSELSQRQETRSFIENYARLHGQKPDQFAAYGYDAGLALIKALGGGARSRADLRRALTQLTPVPGATGPFTFDQSGEYRLEPTLLTVKDRDFILLREPGHGL